MGWVREDRLESDLLAGLQSPGTVNPGPIIETPFGLHIVQVQDRRESGVTPFERVRGTIRKRLDLKRRQAVSEALLADERNLGSRTIDINLEAIESLLAEFNIKFQTSEPTEEAAASGEPEESVSIPNPGERRVP